MRRFEIRHAGAHDLVNFEQIRRDVVSGIEAASLDANVVPDALKMSPTLKSSLLQLPTHIDQLNVAAVEVKAENAGVANVAHLLDERNDFLLRAKAGVCCERLRNDEKCVRVCENAKLRAAFDRCRKRLQLIVRCNFERASARHHGAVAKHVENGAQAVVDRVLRLLDCMRVWSFDEDRHGFRLTTILDKREFVFALKNTRRSTETPANKRALNAPKRARKRVLHSRDHPP